MTVKHLLTFCFCIAVLASCKTTSMGPNYTELAKASAKLGLDIRHKDNHTLYIEASKWIGVPYKYGGNTKQGVDCSGFTSSIYHQVYHQKLSRTAFEQRTKDCRKIAKRHLKEGDLVFFSSKGSKKTAHVGIYLKENKFIHASTSRGVIVSSLNDHYYSTYWISGGRVH